MRLRNPPFSNTGLIGTCLSLAHATFYDALPANVDHKPPIAPENAALSNSAAAPGLLRRAINAVDGWSYRQRIKEREAYLARSTDLHDLESRLRTLERRPYF